MDATKKFYASVAIGTLTLSSLAGAATLNQPISNNSDTSQQTAIVAANGPTPASTISNSFLGSNALLTGYGSATYIARERTHSTFGAEFAPIFLFRYDDILLWESEVKFIILLVAAPHHWVNL